MLWRARHKGDRVPELLAEKEREAIVAALQQMDGIQTKAAKLLGSSERSLWYRVKKLRIDPAVVHRPL